MAKAKHVIIEGDPVEGPMIEVPNGEEISGDGSGESLPEIIESTEALVLVDCALGKCGEVVLLPTDEAETGAASGVLDLTPEAIDAYR